MVKSFTWKFFSSGPIHGIEMCAANSNILDVRKGQIAKEEFRNTVQLYWEILGKLKLSWNGTCQGHQVDLALYC